MITWLLRISRCAHKLDKISTVIKKKVLVFVLHSTQSVDILCSVKRDKTYSFVVRDYSHENCPSIIILVFYVNYWISKWVLKKHATRLNGMNS